MTSRHQRFSQIAVSVCALALLFPATAHAGTTAPSTSAAAEVTIPEGSVLASPEEVAQMGGSAAAVAQQATLWAALPEATRAEQQELNAAAHVDAQAAFANVVAAPRPLSRLTRNSVSPLVFRDSCYGQYSSQDYKIGSANGQPTQCYAGGAGTYYLTTTFKDYGNTAGIKVQAANHTGRVYYRIWNAYFWSTTRYAGDYNWYTFTINYDNELEVLRVQLY